MPYNDPAAFEPTSTHRVPPSIVGAIVGVAASAATLVGCNDGSTPADPTSGGETSGTPWFEESGAARGLSFVHDSGMSPNYYMPEMVSGGAALFDMDGDGDLDAYLLHAGDPTSTPDQRKPNQLFENQGDGTFRNVTEGSGLDSLGLGMGVACGDYDNDGDVDLCVTNLGFNELFRNEGGGRFVDVSATAGIDDDDSWSASCGFFDYDRDGDLDLFITNYMNWSLGAELECYNAMDVRDYCSPTTYDLPSVDLLYRNNGDQTFTNVTAESGVEGASGNGLGVGFADFNGDGWIDVFVANDLTPDHLWVNQGDGTFEEKGLLYGCAVDQEGAPKAGMGVVVCDIDDDRDPDLMVCNLSGQNDSLFVNENGYFIDRSLHAGHNPVSRKYTRFGMGWVDFDNDRRMDLYEANGRVSREDVTPDAVAYAEPNILFQMGEDGRFNEIKPVGGTREDLIHISRAAAFGDIDNDGGMDVLVINQMDDLYLLYNVVPNRGHWMLLNVIDEHGRDAIGATVTITIGQSVLTRPVQAAYSYLASNDPRVHVGLGDAERADDVVVNWIDGTSESFATRAGDQIHTLRRGEGTVVTN